MSRLFRLCQEDYVKDSHPNDGYASLQDLNNEAAQRHLMERQHILAQKQVLYDRMTVMLREHQEVVDKLSEKGALSLAQQDVCNISKAKIDVMTVCREMVAFSGSSCERQEKLLELKGVISREMQNTILLESGKASNEKPLFKINLSWVRGGLFDSHSNTFEVVEATLRLFDVNGCDSLVSQQELEVTQPRH